MVFFSKWDIFCLWSLNIGKEDRLVSSMVSFMIKGFRGYCGSREGSGKFVLVYGRYRRFFERDDSCVVF